MATRALESVAFEPVASWGLVVERVRARKRSLSALLEQAELIAFDGATLRLGFAEPFLVESVSEKDAAEVVLSHARELAGPKVRLVVEWVDASQRGLAKTLAQTRQETTTAERERARDAIVRHPNVLAAQDVLGAKVIEVRLKTPQPTGS